MLTGEHGVDAARMAYAICNYVALYYVLYIIQAISCVVSLFGSVVLGFDAIYWCYAVVIAANAIHVIFVFLPNAANYDNPSRGTLLNFFEQSIIIASDVGIVGTLTVLSLTSAIGAMSMSLLVAGTCASLASYLALLCLIYFANRSRNRTDTGSTNLRN